MRFEVSIPCATCLCLLWRLAALATRRFPSCCWPAPLAGCCNALRAECTAPPPPPGAAHPPPSRQAMDAIDEGRPEEALQALGAAHTLLTALGKMPPVVFGAATGSYAKAALGDYAGSLRCARLAVQCATRPNVPFSVLTELQELFTPGAVPGGFGDDDDDGAELPALLHPLSAYDEQTTWWCQVCCQLAAGHSTRIPAPSMTCIIHQIHHISNWIEFHPLNRHVTDRKPTACQAVDVNHAAIAALPALGTCTARPSGAEVAAAACWAAGHSLQGAGRGVLQV